MNLIFSTTNICCNKRLLFNTKTLFQQAFSHHLRRMSAVAVKMPHEMKLGFLGTGKIAQALILGMLNKHILRPEQIYVNDENKEYLMHLKEKNPLFQKHKINFIKENVDLFDHTDTIMICLKPKDILHVLNRVTKRVTKSHLMLSLAAGIQLKQIEQCLSSEARVIRIMTNLPALVQEGCSVYSKGTNATEEDAICVQNLLKSIGSCENEVNEDLMNAITALSGSGPAYMFLILDALADGGVKMGLSRQLSIRLAAQTMFGSAKMVLAELKNEPYGKHIMQMKEEVCSPGGTTIHGMAELEDHKIRSAFFKCLDAATKRGKEMSLKNDQEEEEENNKKKKK